MKLRAIILLWLFLCLLFAALGARAQTYSGSLVSLGVTNNVWNNATNTSNLGSAIDVRRYSQVAFVLSFNLEGNGSNAPCTFNFISSTDSNRWDTTPRFSVTLTPPGSSNTVCTNVSFDLGAVGYLKLTNIIAGQNNSAMTNIYVGRVFKPYRYDRQ